jgi:DNA-binding MarR family transcriptional regulator
MARTAAPRSTSRNRVRDGVVIRPDGLKYMTPERASAFLGLLRAGEALARELDAELERDHGIGLKAFEVLLFLAVFSPDGRLRMLDLIERTPLSQSRVSRLVAELDARGLVVRAPSGDDGRGVEVAITPKGIQKFKEAQDDHIAGLQRRLFAHLSADEVHQLATLTERIINAQRTTSGSGRPPRSVANRAER